MSSPLDEKKHLIIPLLDKLRPYNPEIGSYIKSLYTTDFDYSVKLSNGRLRLAEDLVDDMEHHPEMISEARLRRAAFGFVADEPTQRPPIATINTEPMETVVAQKRGLNVWQWCALVALLLIAVVSYSSYQRSREAAAKHHLEEQARTDIYKQLHVETSPYQVNRLFGGVSNVRLTVTNDSDYLVDLVKIKISYIKADGGLYKEEYVYFNRVSGHSAATLPAPDSERGTSIKISFESMTCTALHI